MATVSSGPITKFGSVFVSGTEFDNTHALYCIDDEPCTTTNSLKLGMVILVNGTAVEDHATNQLSNRVAQTITYEETVEGVVQSVAGDGLSLVVLGQVVHINQYTQFDTGVSISALRPGQDIVEVSGFVIGDGHILATRLSLQTGAPHYEVQGTVKHHDPANHRFEIGALTVTYDASTDTSLMPPLTSPSASWNNLVVHVRGDSWSSGGSGPYGATLPAGRIKPLSLGISDIEDAALEGFITFVSTTGDVLINNVPVRTTASTVFEGGGIGDLVLDAHVEVHGHIISDVLEADHIAFKGSFELEANVATIDPATSTLTLSGLTGTILSINHDTAISGEGNLRTFADLAVGDHLKIHGRPSGGTGILATELERSTPSTKIRLQGPVQSSANPNVTVAGSTIDTSGFTDSQFRGSDGVVIGRSGFFSGLTTGQKITVSGTETGGFVTWTSLRRSSGH